MTGTVGILNVGAGDITLSFDPANAIERIRSARIVRDMIRRGYALLVEVERDGVKSFERALDFDEAHCRYLIADFAPETVEREFSRPLAELAIDKGMENDHGESGTAAEAETPETSAGKGTKKSGRRGKFKSVDAGTTRAVAVGRSSGG
jgi:hypothetical protein